MQQAWSLIIDQPEEGRFGVYRRAFTDPEVFDLEMRKIFEASWIYLAHESQLPNPGDFFATTMGRRSVVVVRGADGAIGAFLNACAHRGSALVRTERGNRRAFVCPYHGWTYGLDGRGTHVKAQDSGGYSDAFAREPHDLTAVPRVEAYRGFVFGSLRHDVPLLEDHLAGAKGFIDLVADQSPQGLEVLKGGATYRFRGNWKLQAENGIDGYHFDRVHGNYVRVLNRRAERARESGETEKLRSGFDASRWGADTGWYDLGNGHEVIWLNIIDPEGRPLWERREELARRLGGERADWMLHRQRNLLVFPNLHLMDQNSTQIRVTRPLAPDLTEVRIYCFAPRGESAAARERRIRQYEDFFNASGMATPDDLTVFEAVQKGCRATGMRLQGYDRGLGRPPAAADPRTAALDIRPVASGADAQDENVYRGLYREWARLMGKVVR